MRLALRRSLTTTSIYCLVALAPIAVWTLRNWVTFHVFQPLAPRYLGDPGDRPNVGVYRWIRTWSVEYTSTAVVFWQVGVGPIDPDDLPARAFDSPAERAQTLALLDEYNHTISVSADLDHRFGALAAERIRAHPFRYYVALPLAAHRRHDVSSPHRGVRTRGLLVAPRRPPRTNRRGRFCSASSISFMSQQRRGHFFAVVSPGRGCWAVTSFCAVCCLAPWKTPSRVTLWSVFPSSSSLPPQSLVVLKWIPAQAKHRQIEPC